MTKTLLIIAHPSLHSSSKMHNALYQDYLQHQELHHDVQAHLLYDLYPAFDLDVAKEQALLIQHDRIILQFPVMWYSCPPLLKKWIDDVLVYQFAYGPGGDKVEGKELKLVLSTAGNTSDYSGTGYNTRELKEYLYPFEQTAKFCRMKYAEPFVAYAAPKMSQDEVAEVRKNYIKLLGS